jgi:hypothetical protein
MAYQSKRTLRNIFATLLILAAITACSTPVPAATPPPAASPEPAATPEPTPTPTPQPTPTLEPSITVCATGCDFTTIQAAIDDPGTTSGDIIGITDAIHTEESITVNKNVTILGQAAGGTVVQAHVEPESATDRVFLIPSEGMVTIKDITIRHGNPTSDPGDGGGILNQGTLTLERCFVRDNSARNGGGILNLGTLTLERCILTDNGARGGGGIYNEGTVTLLNSTVSDNIAGRGGDPLRECATGGGIKSLTGTLALNNSTVSGNISRGNGGGIFLACKSTLELINSTISGNEATGGSGGGICLRGAADFVSSTITGNRAADAGGGVYIRGSGERGLIRGWLDFTNTIIANNTTGNEYGGADCMLGQDGTIGINSNNLVQDGGCNPDYSGDPLLGSLADNGGDTQTHALLAGSPAIDAISVISCTVTTDQRGGTRPIAHTASDTPCDIGAFELQMDEG